MSRRLLFAAAGTVAPPDPEPDPDALSTAWHGEHTAAMMPDWGHVIRVGPGRTHPTLAAGLTAARALPYAKPGAAPTSRWGVGVRTGFGRVVVVLDPGTYTVTDSAFGSGVDIIGNGDTRDDVIIYTATAAYNVNPWFGFYLANVTLYHDQGPTGNNYALHGSQFAGFRDHTAIIDNVTMLDTNTGSSGIAGWDMAPGMRAVLYRCRFESTTSHGNVLHDEVGSDVEALFLECESDVALAVQLGTRGDDPIGKTWVIDCTELDGTPIPDTATLNDEPTAAPTDVPTLPSNGMTTTEAAKYAGGLVAAGAELVPAYPSTANLSGFVAGRTIYVPLPLPQSVKVGGARVNVTTPDGTVAMGIFIGDTPLSSGFTYFLFGEHPSALTATAGNMTRAMPADDAALWLPGGTELWLAVRVNDADCVLRGSTTMAASTQCYYTDDDAFNSPGINPFPTGITALPSGSAVPWVALVAA